MNDENLRILKMVEEGKISSEKGIELLEALNAKEETKIVSSDNYKNKILRIKVKSSDGDNVSVNLPVSVIKSVVKATGKIPMNVSGMEGIDIEDLTNTILAAFDNEVAGEIVDVQSANGDIVKIVIE